VAMQANAETVSRNVFEEISIKIMMMQTLIYEVYHMHVEE